MRHFFIRSQVVFVAVLLFLTLTLTFAIVRRHNQRWDYTKEKIYSLSEPMMKLLKELAGVPLEVLAFYPQQDPARDDFEVFLKECKLHHPNFRYVFYDPDRMPRLASEYRVKDLYTVIVRTANRQERMQQPTEQKFANALLRVAQPETHAVCFVTGHAEAALSHEDRNGLQLFRQALEDSNIQVHEIILARDSIPPQCNVLVVAGPHRDFDNSEYDLLKKAFQDGRGIFFLLDPMDPGRGSSFQLFMKEFGVSVGSNVLIDKMSRMVGGDFLVPLISQYVSDHPITAQFTTPTFFPVARTVQPSGNLPPGLEVVPLALSGEGSWAEANLRALEKGEATFEPAADLAGPLSVAVAVEEKPSGRMVVVGDSDFVTNAYIDLSGNQTLALNMIQWLAKDDRFIAIRARQPEFQPLLLNPHKNFAIFLVAVVIYPVFFLLFGAVHLRLRNTVR